MSFRGAHFVSLLGLVLAGCGPVGPRPGDGFREPPIEWSPPRYLCLRAGELLEIDGRLDEAAWARAPWTADFIDIEGPSRPPPRFTTRARMLWDDTFFYLAAEMKEPHLWATLTERDSVIFQDNDFEVFIDPDGDTYRYVELEINALGTEWDLLLPKPYRDGGLADNAFDLAGLETAIHLEGTLNDPSDLDRGWTVEMAIPWEALAEAVGVPGPPRPGDRWRVNFSRVQWRTRIENGTYVKLTDPRTGEPMAEDNWVWSAQGLVNMHYPEMWGIVQFSGNLEPAPGETVGLHAEDRAGWALRRVYYRQRTWRRRHGAYCTRWSDLGVRGDAPRGWSWPPSMEVTRSGFEASIVGPGGERMSITQDGRLRHWKITR